MTGQGLGVGKSEIGLLEIVNVILKRRHLVLRIGVVTAILVFLFVAFSPREYSASALFVPDSQSGVGRTMSLVSQFGFTVPGGSQSPDFYVDLIRSRTILSGVAAKTYEVSVPSGFPFFRRDGIRKGSLAFVLDIDTGSEVGDEELSLIALRGMLSVSTTRSSGIVSVTVRAQSPDLAYQIVEEILRLTHQFNLSNRQSQASAERKFTEERLGVVQNELRLAENEQQEFLKRNRQIQSPELQFENARLEREVQRRQQLFNTLSQAYEQARIDEVRNTPVITLVEQPSMPVLASRRRLLTKTFAGMIAGGLLGISIALLSAFSGTRRDEQEITAPEEFAQLKAAISNELRSPSRFFSRQRRSVSKK